MMSFWERGVAEWVEGERGRGEEVAEWVTTCGERYDFGIVKITELEFK